MVDKLRNVLDINSSEDLTELSKILNNAKSEVSWKGRLFILTIKDKKTGQSNDYKVKMNEIVDFVNNAFSKIKNENNEAIILGKYAVYSALSTKNKEGNDSVEKLRGFDWFSVCVRQVLGVFLKRGTPRLEQMANLEKTVENELFRLGQIAENERNIDKAIDRYLEAGRYGNLDALNRAGELFKNQNNIGQARENFKVAAGQGHKRAQENLDLIMIDDALNEYNSNKDPYKDPDGKRRASAQSTLQVLAEKGYPKARDELDRILIEQAKVNVESDNSATSKTAWENLEKLAARGYSEAQYCMSKKLFSEEERLEWLNKAADQGHLGAQYDLAVLLSGYNSNPVDREKAKDLLKTPIEQGIRLAKLKFVELIDQKNDEELQKSINLLGELVDCSLSASYSRFSRYTEFSSSDRENAKEKFASYVKASEEKKDPKNRNIDLLKKAYSHVPIPRESSDTGLFYLKENIGKLMKN